MRKLLISILLAGAAVTPALAAPNDDDRRAAREEREQAREERQQAREARSERANVERREAVRPERPERASRQQSFDRQQQVRGDRDDRRATAQDSRSDRAERRQQITQDARDRRALRQDSRAAPPATPNRAPVISRTPREGTQPPPPAQVRPAAQPQWSTSWRHNDRYDWRGHRNRHRSLFHLGFYYDPFGWNYSRYQIGWRLWPSYYGSRYWIHDPWRYRLPYAPAGYRWVRYWDDAVLVDTWSGQVVDVIYDFFW